MKMTYQRVADTIDMLEHRDGRRPTQAEVAVELDRSERLIRDYWPTKSPEVLVVERTLEGASPGGAIAGVIRTVLTETVLENPDTGEPFEDGRNVQTEIDRLAAVKLRAVPMGVGAISAELGLDRERVRYLLEMDPPA
jgi:hypothetical protein